MWYHRTKNKYIKKRKRLLVIFLYCLYRQYQKSWVFLFCSWFMSLRWKLLATHEKKQAGHGAWHGAKLSSQHSETQQTIRSLDLKWEVCLSFGRDLHISEKQKVWKIRPVHDSVDSGLYYSTKKKITTVNAIQAKKKKKWAMKPRHETKTERVESTPQE